MAIYITKFNGKSSHTQEDMSYVETDILSTLGGVVDIENNDLKVTQTGTASNFVDIGSGVGYIPDVTFAQNTRSTSTNRFTNDTTVSVQIASNTSGNDRIDIVCAKYDSAVTPDATGSNVITIVVVQGTPAASPVPPATPNDHLKLADVLVQNGFSTILDADITDSRLEIPVRMISSPDRAHVFQTGGQSIANNTETVLTFTTEAYDVGGLVDLGANNNRITIVKRGLYQIGYTVTWAVNSTGFRRIRITINGGASDKGSQTLPTTDTASTTTTGLMDQGLSPSDYIGISATQNSGGSLSASSAYLWIRRVAEA